MIKGHSMFLLLFKKCICLFEGQRYKESERENERGKDSKREREISSDGSLPTCPEQPGLNQAEASSQNFFTKFSMWVAGA